MNLSDKERQAQRTAYQDALDIVLRARPETIRTPRGQQIADFADKLVAQFEEKIIDLGLDAPTPSLPQGRVVEAARNPNDKSKDADKTADAEKTAQKASRPASRGRRGRPARDMSTAAPGQKPVGAMTSTSAGALTGKSADGQSEADSGDADSSE